MTHDERREATIRQIAIDHDIDPKLLLDLIALEADHSNLHAYGARARLRRAAEGLIDGAFGRSEDSNPK